MAGTPAAAEPVLLDVQMVRARYGGMPRSTFYRLLQEGRMPKPCYPFGTRRPFWRVEDLAAFEKSFRPQLEAA